MEFVRVKIGKNKSKLNIKLSINFSIEEHFLYVNQSGETLNLKTVRLIWDYKKNFSRYMHNIIEIDSRKIGDSLFLPYFSCRSPLSVWLLCNSRLQPVSEHSIKTHKLSFLHASLAFNSNNCCSLLNGVLF